MVMYDDTDLELPFFGNERDSEVSGSPDDVEQRPAAIYPAAHAGTTDERPHCSLLSLASLCVLGGVTVAPLLAILGCIGLAMSATSPLHQVASLLMCAALLWLGVALITAQTMHGETASDMTPDSEHRV